MSEGLTGSLLGHPTGSPTCSALLSLVDWRGAALCACPGGSLRFRPHSQAGQSGEGCGAGVWLLASPSGAPGGGSGYSLQHAASGRFLAVTAGRVALADAPQPVQLFMDMERSFLLTFPSQGKVCLQSDSGGAVLAGSLPLGRSRASKLFRLQEVGLPQHSLQPWPLRCVLRCDAAGGAYLSATGRALAAAAPAACCSEEFLLALGQGAPLASKAGSLVAPGSSVWSGDGECLLSGEPLTGQVLLAPVRSCTGGESFTLCVSPTGELSLLAEPAQQQQQQQQQQQLEGAATGAAAGSVDRRSGSGATSGSEGAAADLQPAPVVVQQGGRLALQPRGSKPTKFGLELASHRPTLLLTAHGHLVGSRSRSSERPCGILPAAAQSIADEIASGIASRAMGSSSDSGGSSSLPDSSSMPGPSAAAVRACAWRLEHHGDGIYSLQTDSDRRRLYIDDAGVPCLDGPAGPAGTGGSLLFPDPRLLFWIEPAWVQLGAGQEGGGSSSSSGSSSSGSSSSGGHGGTGHVTDGCDTGGSGASGASGPTVCRHPSGFVLPGPSGLVAAGFALRSVQCVRGRHLYLSALPDGLLTTVQATAPPSRWEIFSVVDVQTLLASPLGMLRHLPCAAVPSPQPLLRRVASMQALRSGSSQPTSICGAGFSPLPRPPSLPAVQEHQPAPPASWLAQGHHCSSAPHLLSAAAGRQQELSASLPPRRSQSDSALSSLPRQATPQRWLAELSRPARQPAGWVLRSAASLQEVACRALCASLVQRWQEQQGGRRQLPASLVQAVEKELSALLPEELAAGIGCELRLLAGPPPATKLSLQQCVSKAAGTAADGPPDWVARLVEREQGTAWGQWQPTEAYLCCACRGASGVLLPLCPYTSPQHHLFLAAMERRARGGGRVRLRARRRLDQEDPLTAVLRAGRAVLLGWFAAKTLGALLAPPRR